MSAIGINVSDKDKTHDWTGLRAGHRNTPEIQEADEEEKRLWDYFTTHVDEWIAEKYFYLDRGDSFRAQELMNRIAYHQERAELATLKAQMLRKQRYCKHAGTRYQDEGSVFCSECGAEIIHDSSISDIADIIA